jgi:hypothetical protein
VCVGGGEWDGLDKMQVMHERRVAVCATARSTWVASRCCTCWRPASSATRPGSTRAAGIDDIDTRGGHEFDLLNHAMRQTEAWGCAGDQEPERLKKGRHRGVTALPCTSRSSDEHAEADVRDATRPWLAVKRYCLSMSSKTSTRRLLARPAAVAFEPTGSALP